MPRRDESYDPVFISDLVLHCVTDKSILVAPRGLKEKDAVWIPISEIASTSLDYESDEGLYGVGYIEIPMWLARDRHLGGY